MAMPALVFVLAFHLVFNAVKNGSGIKPAAAFYCVG